MSKIGRFTQKIFASGASNNGVVGSLQLGTRVDSNDPATIMGLPAWAAGLNLAIVGGQQVLALEELQSLSYIATTQLAYLLQEGIPEYDAGTTYFINSIVKKPNTYQIWGSKIDTNVGNALVAGANWQFLQDLSNPSAGVLWCGTATGTGNAILLASTKPYTAYTAGQPIAFLPAADNVGGTITVNINSIGTRNLSKNGGQTNFAPKDIETGVMQFGIDNGTTIEMIAVPTFAHGADIASAGTINLNTASGMVVDITGSVAITAMTLDEGSVRFLRFQNALVLTSGGSLILPGSGNITTAAGDYAIAIGYASGVVRVIYFRKDGRPITPQQRAYYSSTSSGTFTTSANINANTTFEVELTGGGGGASGNNNATSGNGGGAGATVQHQFTGLAPSTGYAYTIGAGGAGGTAGANAGGVGGSSSMTISATTITAIGGGGGAAGVPGLGGVGGTASGGNIANIPGGDGMGGSGANNVVCGGIGGASFQGGGGGGIQAYSSSVKGNNAQAYGGGGGASANNANAASAGGDGKSGIIKIRWIE